MRTNSKVALGLVMLAFVVTAAACSKSATAMTPSPVLATDTFTGTINPLGSASHSFVVTYASANSDASITVNSLVSVATETAQAITIGVGFGTVNVGVCTRVTGYTNVAAPLNTALTTNTSPFAAGTFCVQIFDNPDAPTVTEPLTYSVSVKHY